jgi:hypothetical protein
MAVITKKLISDAVLYKIAGGVPTPSFMVHEQDIWASLNYKINAMFKVRHFDSTLASGEMLPENSMIATYENITVTSMDNGKSYATLPINPISLPLNMGIFMIYDPNYPDNFFIPLQRSQLALLRADELLNNLMGEIGYEPKNDRVIFTQDITMYNIPKVTMELCVLNISDYGVTDALPIPSDYVDGLIQELTNEFAPIIAKTGIISNFTNPTQQPVK